MGSESREQLNRTIAGQLGLQPPAAAIVEPLTVTTVMLYSDGGEQAEETSSEATFGDYAQARRRGRTDCCMYGTRRVTVTGGDGALLASWSYTDNLWHNHASGQLAVTADVQVCSCGGSPSLPTHIPEHFYREPTMGWFWICDRCAAGGWFPTGPSEVAAPPAPAA